MPPGLLDTIAATLDVTLNSRGFPHGERADGGDALIRRWVRDRTWKRDIVEVVYRRGRSWLTVNVSIEVPAAGRHVTVDGTNVGYLSGRPGGYPLPRGWFRSWKLRRLLDRIDRETRTALAWFDAYDSPRSTIEKLRSPERNGCPVGSDPHRQVVAFLESLGDAYPSRRELIDAFERLVPSVFGPVAARHGLALRAVEPRLFVLESDKVLIRVRFGSGHVPDVNVLLGPARANPGYDDLDSDIVGLGLVAGALTGRGAVAAPQVAAPQEILHALETAARVLERDCAPILRGDLSGLR